MPDHSLNLLTVSIWVLRSATVDAIKLASPAYHLLESVRWLEVSAYALFSDLSHWIRGSTSRRNSNGERGSPGRVPLKIWMRLVYP
jgi:hypothetical protein